MRSRSLVSALAALTVLFVSVAFGDTPQSVLLTSPAGNTEVKDAPAYQDIIEAEVTRVGDGGGDTYYVFREGMAGPLTADSSLPSNPGGIKEVLWDWGIDTDGTTFPTGYPFSGKGNTRPYEFMIWLDWDGERFTGVLIDRRPLLRGEQAVLSEIEFAIDGADVLLFVPAALLGDPETFQWRCGTVDVVAVNVGANPDAGVHAGKGAANGNGTDGYHTVDSAGFPFTPFP